jgi:dTDP-4-dehydrorhamnose reductase
MKYLIIGASGFVGSNLLRYIRASKHEAIGTQAIPRANGLTTFDLLGDRLLDRVPPLFFQSGEKACVIVAAVVSDMDRCLLERERSHRINVTNTIRLIEDVAALGAKPVFISSNFVFDGALGYYNEDDPVSPANEYGRHKAEVEAHLVKCVPQALITRFDKVVGHDPRESHLLANWYREIEAGRPVVALRGSLLTPTYVEDVARALVFGAEQDLCGIYHVVNSEFFYREELARQLCRALGKKAEVVARALEEFNFPDKRALNSYLDGSRFAAVAGMRFTPMSEVFRRFRQEIETANSGATTRTKT